MTPEMIAVPVALVGVLTYAMQYVKPLLERFLPGFGVSDASHDANLRVAYWVLAFAAVLGYALATLPTPQGADAWLIFLYGVANTAGAVTFGGHVLYKTVGSGGASTPVASDPSTPADYPLGFTSLTDAGLPTTPDSADVSQQPTAPVPAAAA